MALMIHRPAMKDHPPMVGTLLDTVSAVVSPASSLRQVRRRLATNNAERQALLRNLSRYNLEMTRSRSRNSLNS